MSAHAAPEPRLLAGGSPLGLRGAPSPRVGRRKEAAAALKRLPFALRGRLPFAALRSPPVIGGAFGPRRNELVMPVGMWVYPILGFIQSNKANTERAQEDLKRGLAVLQAHRTSS